MLSDDYQKTRSERTSYNQHFLTLLLVQTLVAVLAAILKESTLKTITYSQMLLAFVFFTAAAISITWALKLWMLKKIVSEQNETLRDMEKGMPAYPMFKTSWNKLIKPELKNELINDYFRRSRQTICRINYYILAVTLFFVFLILGILTGIGVLFPKVATSSMVFIP